jgi:ketosteroid isomerase-like protein
MSKDNIAIARSATDAFNRGDLDAWLGHFDSEVEWYAAPDEPEPGPFRGHDGLLKMVARWTEIFPDIRADADEYIDAGEHVIASVRFRGHTAGSDADVVVDELIVNKYRDGRIVEVREYRTREEALEATSATPTAQGLRGLDAYGQTARFSPPWR